MVKGSLRIPNKILLCFIWLVFLGCVNSYASNVSEDIIQGSKSLVIEGSIVDEEGVPLIGASVMIKGTTIGVSSDENGKFVLKTKPRASIILVIQSIGMEKKEIKYIDGKKVNVVLKQSMEGIVELVVTGYQVLDRRLSSSSTFKISGKDVIQSNATSLDNMLQGKIPGLQVMNATSTAGASTKIRIRGTSTISGNREPLWVVDGVILDDPVQIPTEELNNLDNVNLIGSAIEGLNPMDIESIDILKDASSTAIYGVKAANGVIVVTTKKGSRGKARVNYSGQFSVSGRPSYSKLNRMNSKDRIAVSKEIESRGLTYNFIPAPVGYEGLLYDLYDRKITYDQFLKDVSILEANNTDWFDLLYSNAFSNKHNISISGANDIVNYYFSGGYTSNKSNLNKTGVEQYNALMKLNVKLSKNLSGTLQLRGSFLNKDFLHSSINPYEYAYNTSRAIPAFNPDNTYSYYTKEEGFKNEILGYNILNEIENSDRTINTNQYNINANIEWRIIKGLRLTGTLGLNNSSTNDREWYSDKTYLAASLRRLSYGTPLPMDETWRNEQCRLPYGGGLKNSDTRNFGYTARVQLDYNKTFEGKHNITLVGGSERRSTRYSGLKTTSFGYLPDRGETFVAIDPAQWPKYKEMLLNNQNVVTNRLSNFISLYGIATYAYKSKYIFNANIRADGSNKFGQDKKARFLPIWSVSARWNISEEKLFSNASWLNNLSIKGSYGIQGNVSDDQTPRLIMQLGSLDQLSGEYMSTLSKLPNPFLKWEKTNAYNIALDWAIFGNRLSGTVEYYYKRGRDQIVSYEVPATTGLSYMSLNMGDVMNKGYELIINAVPIRTKDFSWTISLNGAKNVNKVTRGGLESEYTYNQYTSGRAVLEGYPLNSMFSYKFAGLDEKGLPTFKNTDEKEGITKKEMFDNVFVYSGNRVPDIEGGFSNRFNYKNISLGFFFSYSLGSKIRINNLYSNTGQRLPRPDQNMSNEFIDRWQKQGDENITNIPALSTERLDMSNGAFTDREISIADNGWQMYNNSDLRVASGNYLKLRNVNLRYRFGGSVCSKLGISAANISLEAYNLFTIASKKLNGQDPEQVSFGGLGATTPPISSFSMVLNLTF